MARVTYGGTGKVRSPFYRLLSPFAIILLPLMERKMDCAKLLSEGEFETEILVGAGYSTCGFGHVSLIILSSFLRGFLEVGDASF